MRFNMNESDNYGNNGGSSFFTLKNDKDTAKVRFLYESAEDLEGYAVHEIEIDGKRKYVNCLRSYNEPLHKCPFCAAQMPVKAKLFIKLFNLDANECQIWERGKTYFKKLGSLAARYSPLFNEVVEIERNGAKGDQRTDYAFYPVDNTPFDINSVEVPDVVGTLVQDMSAEDMNAYLGNGTADTYSDMPTGRRTPSRPVF